ncbi:asparagine synthase (glutamine-hydrolyzing) [Mucilaginibacter sp. PPCGB 2223]|uniref:asparagine synthase (glutamine-hydrolyzing) n=1 Tax=Mucilaginibacter sp. PPCGB 2223 TaxID=1886027 RepID=UPI0008268256|nr:asparagine synthase (glutamine-hydrolyzing) [Mucilaginibacter sp. PPCGB 2223]OCX54036.1 asparagine synthase (glutamine-hydrolyzing) [Mucilaginibacter sp. PPCGB 2223]
MCGITGFVDFNCDSSADLLQAMTRTMQHRGPDGEGLFFRQHDSFQIGLGHRRLSIIDLSTNADQPMSYDGLHVVFNGEIYNYAELRNELILLGHQFKTHSDTEVILHSWKEWGNASIHRWIGMFAIVLYDEQTNEIIVIRDRAGVKPLYYYHSDGLFAFASELKAIVLHTGFKKEINKNSVASFLQYGYVSAPHSIYNNTFKLAPGYLLKLNLSTRKVCIEQYWNVYDYYNKPKLNISLEDAITATEPILQKAFKYRMVADVPVGIFLSGGYDSTCVTALLQKESTEKLKTFTIGTIENKLDEAPFAKQIATHLNTDHTEYYCTAKEALEIIPVLQHYYDEPFADSSAIPTMLVSRLARETVTVALSADAGDEVFAGYNRYDYIARYGKKIASIPRPIRRLTVSAMKTISSEKLPVLNKMQNFHSRYNKLRNLLNNPSTTELMNNLTQAFTSSEIGQLFSQPILPLSTQHRVMEIDSESDPLAYMMAIDYETYLVDDILQKVDRATMAASLEGREPFLDHHIIEWAAQLPSELKYYKGDKKHIIKQIVHRYVPQQIMDRPKMGFGIPVEKWLRNDLREVVEDYLSEQKLRKHGLFNIAEVRKILTQFYNGRTEKHLQIWYLLMFQMWYEMWF